MSPSGLARWRDGRCAAARYSVLVVRAARFLRLLALFAGATVLAGAQTAPARVDAERLMQDVQALSSPEFEGRLTGTPGSRKAQAFILRRYRELGLQPVVRQSGGTGYEQTFSFTQEAGSGHGAIPGGRREFPEATNLVGAIEGSSDARRYITVSAHYDHFGVRDGQLVPGADDDASGVAAMLAAADHFSRHRPRRSMLFIAFDGEEEGLRGSRYFVANPPIALSSIVLEVNLDMVARGDRNELVAAGTSYSPALKDPLAAIARGRSIKLVFGHDSGGTPDDWTHASDHGPFHSAGVPFIYFGVDDHPDYHKPTDTVARIRRQFFVDATNLIVDALAAIDAR